MNGEDEICTRSGYVCRHTPTVPERLWCAGCLTWLGLLVASIDLKIEKPQVRS